MSRSMLGRRTTGVRPTDERAPRLRSRRDLVLVLAVVTTAVEVLSYAGLVPGVVVGRLTISASIVPGAVLAAVCGGRLLGRSATRHAAASFWVLSVVALGIIGVAYARAGRLVDAGALVLAAFDEELVYRLAAPAAIALALRRLHVGGGRARFWGLALAGAWFVLLPGHRDQMTSPAMAAPFVAFAALSAVIVHRSGSVVPMAVAHATSNLLAVLVWNNAVPADVRSIGLGAVMAVLAVAYGRARPVAHDDNGGLVDIRTGRPVPTIDLRDRGAPPRDLSIDGQPAAASPANV